MELLIDLRRTEITFIQNLQHNLHHYFYRHRSFVADSGNPSEPILCTPLILSNKSMMQSICDPMDHTYQHHCLSQVHLGAAAAVEQHLRSKHRRQCYQPHSQA
eukprot:TRINITY_DN110269_c0_g1_i1.p1 TRINITY_DN110269_c0_g1~~TRINITY_DN110269_c0_g1_i1.p1  ORF type:complete len:103 (-),score=1.06 TRINITY_DN110269_c0_g1_i1:688-996(-)